LPILSTGARELPLREPRRGIKKARIGPMISPLRRSFRQNVLLGRRNRMGQYRGLLTPEERARIAEIQDLLIDRFVEHREATAEEEDERVKRLEAEIDDLLREKEEVEKWATLGSA
jgi:hypothetical protein